MTDDLVKRLRSPTEHEAWLFSVPYQAADRIEALDKRNKELEAVLREIMEVSDQKSYGFALDSHAVYFRIARAALAGEKKDEP